MIKDIEDLSLDWLAELNQLIIENLSDSTLNNARLAKELFLSERSFYRKVVKRTGLTPNRYIRSIRLQKAMELLQSDYSYTIKEVSAKVGFKKSTYFSQLFKEEFEVYPVEILKNKDSHNNNI